MSASPKPWKFRRISFNGDRLGADIGPGIPRLDIHQLDLPPAEPAKTERCWLCLGKGDDGDGSPCPNCEGTGQIGGQS